MTAADRKAPKQTRGAANDATGIVDRARANATTALDKARGAADDAGERVGDVVAGNPLATLVGGIVVGVLAGLSVPRSEREIALLGPVGKKLTEGAMTAARAAREAGTAELAAAGLSRAGAGEQVGKLIEGVIGALSSAGAAAKDSRKPKA